MPVNNKAKDVLKIAENVLARQDRDGEEGLPTAPSLMLQEAVAIQDTLKYDEPPDWFFPVRESLGAALMMKGDSAGAEKVFREDLDRNPRNPRSLFGLQQALKKQGRDYDAGFRGEAIQDVMEGRGHAAQARRSSLVGWASDPVGPAVLGWAVER